MQMKVGVGIVLLAAAVIVGGTRSAVAQRERQSEGESKVKPDDEGKTIDTLKLLWDRLKYLEGAWLGEGTGVPGVQTQERNYEFVLQDQYLWGKTRAVFPRQASNPRGELHEDWEIFSYDKKRKKLVMRQFNAEGYMLRYVLDTVSDDRKEMVFISEQLENCPEIQARITYQFRSPNEFHETFEIAKGGNAFRPILDLTLKRDTKTSGP